MSNPSNLYPKNFNLWAVIPAAGSGRRFATDALKQYQLLCGQTVLEHSIRALSQLPLSGVVLAIAEDDDLASKLSFATSEHAHFCVGGAERVNSVLNALNYLSTFASPEDWVLVHDAARPCVHIDSLNQLVNVAIEQQQSAILATPVRDTLKKSSQITLDQYFDGASKNLYIAHTVSREDLWQAQTPQIAQLAVLKAVLEQALADGVSITDEASALEHCEYPVHLVMGRADNIKITYPEDLGMAELILTSQQKNKK